MLFYKVRKHVDFLVSKQDQKKLIKQELNGGGTGIEADLLLVAHALEKGMGLPRPRSKFGLEKAEKLLSMLEVYYSNGLDTQRYPFVESLSVLNVYLKFTDNECKELKVRCQRLCDNCCKQIPAGTSVISNMEELYNGLNIEQIVYFIQSRHSIRSFQKEKIDTRVISKVVDLAQNAPSACNRQPVMVHWTCDPEKVKEIDHLIPGNKGFEGEIPNWAIITADRKMFGSSEPLQWYVNGGIYLAYFVEALHAFKLGSCIFQIPATHPDTPLLRIAASIPENEAIIAAVGFGYPESPNKYLAATRKPADEVLVEF